MEIQLSAVVNITSLTAGQKDDRQRKLYDDMFAKVNTRYLDAMIRATDEPQNDNADAWTHAFDAGNFKYCEHTPRIAKAEYAATPPDSLSQASLPPSEHQPSSSEKHEYAVIQKGTRKP